MRAWNSSPQVVYDDTGSVHSDCSYETFLSTGEESFYEEIQVSDSESSYETLVVRPSGKTIVKEREEIEVSDYVTDSEAEEEARVRRENRKKKKASKANSKAKRTPPAPKSRASGPIATRRKPAKPTSRQENPTKKSSGESNEKNNDDEKEEAEDGPEDEPEPEPNKPVERMKYTPKDYYHGFSRDHCNVAKEMRREWKHKSKERMEARKKALEESTDSETDSEKRVKRVVTKVVVVKEVEVEIPAETAHQKKQKPLKTIQVRKTRQVVRPKRVKKEWPQKFTEKEEKKEVDSIHKAARPNSPKEEPKPKRKVPMRDKEKEEHLLDVETGKKCYMWYARLGQPNKKQFIKRVQKILDEGTPIGIKIKDIEALPWDAGGLLLSVSKMNSLFLDPEDLSDGE